VGRPRRSPADLDLCLQYRAASWKTLRPLCCWSAAHGRWCCDSETGSRLVFLVGGYVWWRWTARWPCSKVGACCAGAGERNHSEMR
jgi:hypothetical protein